MMSTQLLDGLDDDTRACLAFGGTKWMNGKGIQASVPERVVDAGVPAVFRSGQIQETRIIHHSHIKSARVPVMSCWIRVTGHQQKKAGSCGPGGGPGAGVPADRADRGGVRRERGRKRKRSRKKTMFLDVGGLQPQLLKLAHNRCAAPPPA